MADEWVEVARVEDCEPGCAKFVSVGESVLAVFHLTGPDRFVITANACPHAGANLAAGRIEDNVVTCPWHHWAFNLDTGRCTLSETARLRRYECRVENGRVLVRLPIAPA